MRSGAHMPTSSCRTLVPTFHCTRPYTNYSIAWVLEGLGRRGNQSQVERVETSSGRVNVVSGVGKWPPISHSLDAEPPRLQVIVHGTTAASFAHDASTLLAIRAIMSAFLSLSNLGVVVTAEMLKRGGCRSVVHTILQQRVRAKHQRPSPETLLTFRIHNPSRIK